MSEMIYDNVIRTETLEMDRGERVEMMVDIYESADAVRNDEVMINTEMMSTERQQELQHTGRVSVKNRRHRSVQVCLCLLSVLLFTAVIVICVYFTNKTNRLLTHNYNLTIERKELLTHNYNLTKEREVLLTHNYNLTKENERLLRKYIEILNQSRILTEEREKFRNKSYELQRGLHEQDRRSDHFKWIYYNCSFYYISSDQKSWSDSRRECKDRGANLVIINNKEEQEFVQKAIDGQYYYWIGLSKEEELWKWVDGTTMTLRFWLYGHPKHNHTCSVTTASAWVSHSCNRYERWICEKRILQSLII